MTSRLPGTISLPLKATTHAVYTLKDGSTEMLIMGEKVHVAEEDCRRRMEARGGISERPFQVVHDLLHDSLFHLTSNPADCTSSASAFLSAFSHNAVWNATTTSYPHQNIIGFSPQTAFLRHRFPLITFEWHINSAAASDLAALRPGKSCELTTSWTAWASGPLSSDSPVPEHPLVARGRVNDHIIIVDNAYPVITHRDFIVDHLIQPDLMGATSLKLSASPTLGNKYVAKLCAKVYALLIFIASFSSPKRSSTILGISAFLASAQGFIDDDDYPLTTFILAAIASLAALLAITALSVDSALGLWKMAASQATVVGSADAFVEGETWQNLSEGSLKSNGKKGDKRGSFQSNDSDLLV